jgi:hypothetical protein
VAFLLLMDRVDDLSGGFGDGDTPPAKPVSAVPDTRNLAGPVPPNSRQRDHNARSSPLHSSKHRLGEVESCFIRKPQQAIHFFGTASARFIYGIGLPNRETAGGQKAIVLPVIEVGIGAIRAFGLKNGSEIQVLGEIGCVPAARAPFGAVSFAVKLPARD